MTAGLTLAAITLPEQIATAHLGGFAPQAGIFAFVAATLGFALFGGNRLLTAGADSTTVPIFAGTLAALAVTNASSLPAEAAALAILVGGMLIVSSLMKLGWVSGLLSVPIITGFLIGISGHIVVSQLPELLGISVSGDTLPAHVGYIIAHMAALNPYTLATGLGVLAIMLVSEKLSGRLPGALIAIVLATLAVSIFKLTGHGVSVMGAVPFGLPQLTLPDFSGWARLVPLALIITLIVMMQTAAVSQSMSSPGGDGPDIDRDFRGMGVGNLIAALVGAFPVNASPPRTAVVAQAGGTSQLAAIVASVCVVIVIFWGGDLFTLVPQAAFAGILLFVAQRICRVGTVIKVIKQTPLEGGLVILTAVAVIALPIQTGVAIGIGLSLLHGVAMILQTRPVELSRLPGTTIWWPQKGNASPPEDVAILVVAFQAPLLFANADVFRRGMIHKISAANPLPQVVILEASGIADIDYSAAQAFIDVIAYCRLHQVRLALARLESLKAQDAFERFGIMRELGEGCFFHSVDEAVNTLKPSLTMPTGDVNASGS
ncbi:SulP family inorganic anion transporter [Asticcacaulis sp. AC466]|uniref:SulP family inorganic anion transporter n=1 Tax=Asticcacaulis sp. AC466 TaxID=1282362 RepID=UPI0021018BEA|nr:SulP family inorganic anion transporter [Asticcacaulis sp. AC466]